MSLSRRTFLKTTGTVLAFPAILRAQAGAPSTQQQKFNMEIKRIASEPSVKGPVEYFTGAVRIDPLFEPPDPARTLGASVTFEPPALEQHGTPTRGARSSSRRLGAAWHSAGKARLANSAGGRGLVLAR